MGAYDELRTIYTRYKHISVQLDIERRSLPAIIAETFNAYLGCPQGFIEPTTRRHRKYVSPAIALKSNTGHGAQLLLNPYNPITDGLPNLDYDDDSRFYFGICVFLEIAEDTYPKEAFGILLSAKQLTKKGVYSININISGREHKVNIADIQSFDKLHESLLDLIRTSLSGMRIEYEPKQGIGFMRFNSSDEEK